MYNVFGLVNGSVSKKGPGSAATLPQGQLRPYSKNGAILLLFHIWEFLPRETNNPNCFYVRIFEPSRVLSTATEKRCLSMFELNSKRNQPKISNL